MQSKKFPLDQIDSAPDHGGRHRARRTSRDRIREFTRVLVVAAALAGIGLFGLRMVGSSVQFDISTLPTATPVASAAAGPGVTVLDGTNASGAASTLAHKLLNAGLNVLTADNYSGEQPATATTVFITDEAYRSAAKKVLKSIGEFPIVVSAQFLDPVTVLIAADFK